jgi:hypothetical protein
MSLDSDIEAQILKGDAKYRGFYRMNQAVESFRQKLLARMQEKTRVDEQ